MARRPVKVAVVAQAAKTARIAWAILTSGESYRAPLGQSASQSASQPGGQSASQAGGQAPLAAAA